MILLITGASHTGKTKLAQKLLEERHFPYLCLDHLKMGLIRSGNTNLTPESPDEELTAYLWPIAREIIKTAIENRQNLIVEGCYVPYDWQKDFPQDYLAEIRYVCLVMSEKYIHTHFDAILAHANDAEARLCDQTTLETVLQDNKTTLNRAIQHKQNYVLIDDTYEITLDF